MGATTERPTADQVRAEPARRRLDEWVARWVFGREPKPVRAMGSDEVVLMWNPVTGADDGVWPACELRRHGTPPEYSADNGAAMAVVARMGQWLFEAEWGFVGGVCAGDWVPVRKSWTAAGWAVRFGGHEATAPAYPLAVCRAALLAVLAAEPTG